MIVDAFLALQTDLPFKIAFKRMRHIRHGHNYDMSEVIEEHRFESHPKNTREFVFKTKLMLCKDCGLHFVDKGFGFRDMSFLERT